MYEAAVVFPGARRGATKSTTGSIHRIRRVDDVTYAPGRRQACSRGGEPSSFPVLPALGVVGGLALLAAAAFAVVRQRRLTPAS